MTPDDFVMGLVLDGGTNLSDFADDPDYCPLHGWEYSGLYHEDACQAFAQKLSGRVT